MERSCQFEEKEEHLIAGGWWCWEGFLKESFTHLLLYNLTLCLCQTLFHSDEQNNPCVCLYVVVGGDR